MNAREAFLGTAKARSPYRDRVIMSEAEAASLEIDITEDMEREFSPKRKEQTMAYTTPSSGNQSAVAPERPSPFDELVSAVSAMRELQGRASGLADRIAGSMPHGVGEAKDKRGASGLVDIVEIAVENIREICGYINDDLQRIERRL